MYQTNLMCPNHLTIIIEKIKKAGGKVKVIKETQLRIEYKKNINPISIETLEYPGYPTDLQAQWMALMTLSDGESTIKETIYKDRFTHVSELIRFGADIAFEDDEALVKGVRALTPAPVMSTDIRASASLILAALGAKGKSSISRIFISSIFSTYSWPFFVIVNVTALLMPGSG